MAISTGTLPMKSLHPDVGVEIGDVDLRLHRGRPGDAKRYTPVMRRTTVAGDGPTA